MYNELTCIWLQSEANYLIRKTVLGYYLRQENDL